MSSRAMSIEQNALNQSMKTMYMGVPESCASARICCILVTGCRDPLLFHGSLEPGCQHCSVQFVHSVEQRDWAEVLKAVGGFPFCEEAYHASLPVVWELSSLQQ
eukprot:235316-Rhodomonas_salina.1